MARRRRFFGQRKSVGSRLAQAAAFGVAVLVAVVAVLYVTLPWTTGFAAKQFLTARGWGPVELHVVRLGLGGVDVRDVALANNVVTVKRLAITYSLADLMQRSVGDVAIVGVRINLGWNARGLTLGPLDLSGGDEPSPQTKPRPARDSGPALHKLTVSDAAITVPLGRDVLTTSFAADLAAEDDRWDGAVTLETRSNLAAAPLARLTWQGVLAPGAPAKWPSQGSLDLDVPELPLIGGGVVSGRGHLDLRTGDGQIVVRAPDRLALNVASLPPEVIGDLPAPLAKALKGGAAFYAAGAKGGPSITWTEKDGAAVQAIDADVGVSFAETWARAQMRATISGPIGQIPERLTIPDLRLSASQFPTAYGLVTGRARITKVDSPLTDAAGDFAADLTFTQPTMEIASATALKVTTAGKFALNGLSLDYAPTQLSVATDDAKTAWGVTLPGHAAFSMLESAKAPPSISIVSGGDGRLTTAFDLVAAGRGLTLGYGSERVTADAPQLRFQGYVVDSNRYDITVTAPDGTLSHPSADARIAKLSTRLLPNGASGSGEMIVTRLLSRPGRVSRPSDAGLRLIGNFKRDPDHIEGSAIFSVAPAREIGRASGRMDSASKSGRIKIEVPRLQFGGDGGIAAKDLLTANTTITALTGVVEADITADWKAGKVTSAGRIALTDLGFQAPNLGVSRLNASLDLNSLWPPRAAAPQRITAAAINVGLSVRDLVLEAGLPGDGTLAVTRATLQAYGGELSVAEGIVPVDGRPAAFTVNVSRLSLASLAAQARVDGLEMKGRLSGSLPMRIADGSWLITDGLLKTDYPEQISYRPATPPAALTGSGDLVAKALSNFAYDSIAMTVNGDLLKDLAIKLTMKGKNPDLYGGYPISFNLNLGGPLGAILRQGVVGYQIGADTVERLQSGPGATAP